MRSLARSPHASGGFPAEVCLEYIVHRAYRALIVNPATLTILSQVFLPLQRCVAMLPSTLLAACVPGLMCLVDTASTHPDWRHRLAAACMLNALAGTAPSRQVDELAWRCITTEGARVLEVVRFDSVQRVRCAHTPSCRNEGALAEG
jgi:hypothetical protein